MKTETLDKVLTLIGKADETELRSILNTAISRQKQLRIIEQQKNLALLQEGDRVRLKNVKPKYLSGTPGTIVGRKGQQFIVQLDASADARAQRRFGSRPVCPANILEKI